MLKNYIFILSLFTLFIMPSCNNITGYSNPGSLGFVEDSKIDCPYLEIERQIDFLLENNNFKPELKDTIAVNWWSENGYDFLNYKCLSINKRLYMITIDSENSNETSLAIRSYYNKKESEWYFAQEFSSVDEYKSKKAMKVLLSELSCQ